MNIGENYNFSFSPDGTRAISHSRLFTDWNCYTCRWEEPNGATRVCTFVNMGTVHYALRARDWLEGMDVEMFT